MSNIPLLVNIIRQKLKSSMAIKKLHTNICTKDEQHRGKIKYLVKNTVKSWVVQLRCRTTIPQTQIENITIREIDNDEEVPLLRLN